MLTIFGIAFSIYLLYNSTNIYLYLIAIVFLLLSSISGFFNIFSSYSYYRSNFYAKKIDAIRKSLKPLDYTPKVAVVVPVYNEDPVMVKNNFLKLLKMDYEKGNLSYYLLDDSDKKYINDFLRNFCASAGIRYIHRKTRVCDRRYILQLRIGQEGVQEPLCAEGVCAWQADNEVQ